MEQILISVIISFILINSIFCSLESCEDLENQQLCESEEIEITNISCWKYNNTVQNRIECAPYPDLESDQKAFYKLYLGLYKETVSGYADYPSLQQDFIDDGIVMQAKDTYTKGETITSKLIELTNDDYKIINSKNTCYYKFIGKRVDDIVNGKIADFPNVTNKNVCYNAIKFDELKNVLDCGFAKIHLTRYGKDYDIQTCYFLPNDKLSETLTTVYRMLIVEELFGQEGSFESMLGIDDEDEEEVISVDEDYEDLKKNKVTKSNKLGRKNKNRKLQDDDPTASFDITVEGKYGKIVKYSSSSNETIIVEEGNGTEDDDDDGDNIGTISTESSNFIKFNLSLLVYILILLA